MNDTQKTIDQIRAEYLNMAPLPDGMGALPIKETIDKHIQKETDEKVVNLLSYLKEQQALADAANEAKTTWLCKAIGHRFKPKFAMSPGCFAQDWEECRCGKIRNFRHSAF